MIALNREQISFLPRFYRLSAIAILSNMMVPLAGLCDTAFLGHLEDIQPLAGVILASILFDYLYRVLKFLRNSTNAMTAQAVGEADEPGIILAILRSSMIALAIALTILVLQYPIQKLGFWLLSGTPIIETEGIAYFSARVYGAPAVLLNFVVLGWLLGKEKNGVVLLISLLANGSNAWFDYLTVYRWGWGSAGAGWATAWSQYLALLVGAIAIIGAIDRASLRLALQQAWDLPALKAAISLKFDILVRFLALITAYSLFTNCSATLGTDLLAENGLLLQIALLSQFTIQGIGMTTQTLIGNFKGQKAFNPMLPLLMVAIINALAIALCFAGSTLLFPETIFGWLTNHGEISQEISHYTVWLLPLLSFTAIAFMLEGYFIGLKESAILRNSALTAFTVFLPLLLGAWYSHSVSLLWSALIAYMAMLIFALAKEVLPTHQGLMQG